MMVRWMTALVGAAALLTSLAGMAETVYVTDKITAGIYAQKFNQGQRLAELPSGAELRILLVDGDYTQVRTADDVTGWVESRFLMKEKPIQLAYLESLDRQKTMAGELKAAQARLEKVADLEEQVKHTGWMRVELDKARKKANAREKAAAEKDKELAAAREKAARLETEQAELQQRLSAALLLNAEQTSPPADATGTPATSGGGGLSWAWLLAAGVLGLALGAFVGATWVDSLVRRRFGGLRIY